MCGHFYAARFPAVSFPPVSGFSRVPGRPGRSLRCWDRGVSQPQHQLSRRSIIHTTSPLPHTRAVGGVIFSLQLVLTSLTHTASHTHAPYTSTIHHHLTPAPYTSTAQHQTFFGVCVAQCDADSVLMACLCTQRFIMV